MPAPGQKPPQIASIKVQRIDDLETRDILKMIFVSLQDQLAIEQASVPTGEELNMKVVVTSTPTFINENYTLPNGNRWYGPWIRVEIFSKGPNTVYWKVNNEFNRESFMGLDTDEIKTVDRKLPQIRTLTLWCDQGGTATVKLFFSR